MQYCKVCKTWKAETEFADERKGYHGNRTWCRICFSNYERKRIATNRRLFRRLAKFWNKHHKTQMPLEIPTH